MIQGEKVGIRAVEFSDLQRLLEWRNKTEFRRYFRENRELNFDQQKTWFFEKCIKDPNTRMFAIVRLEDSLLLGACGLCYIDWVNGSADLSIYIGHEGRYIDTEYAPDAARALMDHAFCDLRIHRLWAEVYGFDDRKRVLFDDLGFAVDGVHPHTLWSNGKWCDSMYFSMISE